MNARKLLPIGIAVLVSACQTTPPQNSALQEARQAFQTASSNPAVASAAQVELDRARKALSAAEQAWADRRNEDETRHLSYLALQRATAARLVGEQREAEDQLKQAGVERERIRADAARGQVQDARQQAAEAGSRADRLQQALQQMSARQTDRGMVLAISDVLFEVGKANLKPGARLTAQRLATVLQQHPERRILVEGHTDNTGSDELNQSLSLRRAEAFRQALVEQGVSVDRVDVRGLGEAFPVASNNTAAGRQQNRRIEVVFSDERGQVKPRP